MELFVTWTVMNTLSVVIILLIILLGKSYLTNKKLVKENDYRRENYRLLKEENDLIKDITLKLNDICINITKPINRKSIPILAIEENTFNTDENENIEGVSLTAIRFKNTQDGVLVYLNGAMVPFKGDIICAPTILQNTDKIDALYNISLALGKKDSNVKYINQYLKSILNQFNK